jgi:hypothetical protein
MKQTDMVTIAILAKDKAHVLPLYLKQIENQTYPASKIKLYIRTNNNNDDTAEILEQWIEKVNGKYSEIHYDSSDVAERVQEYSPHEWNYIRFKVVGRIRQESVDWAKEKGTHYFVADCDNLIVPETIEELVETGLPVVAPMLRNGDEPWHPYSNYHLVTDENGYYKEVSLYHDILHRKIKGLIEVEVVHCTYFIRHGVLQFVNYDDDSGRFEYVIFSDVLRKWGIPQYLDNRRNYGKITFADTEDEFLSRNITADNLTYW